MAWKPKLQLLYSGPNSRVGRLLSVPSLLAKLRYYRPRYCVYLLPSDRSPASVARDRRFFRAGGVRELAGFRALPQKPRSLSTGASLEQSEAYLRFQRLWGDATPDKFPKYARTPMLESSAHTTVRAAQWLRVNRKHPHRPLIAVAPYSNFPSRDIPDDTLGKLLPSLADRADAEIVMVGGRKDFQRAEKLLGPALGLNACGVFSVEESVALLKTCRLAICTESGPMHLCSAIGVPLLATFSRINPDFAMWLPFAQGSTILYREVPCAGCFQVNCPVAGHPCMTGITPGQILGFALKILQDIPVAQTTLNGTRFLTR